MREKHGKRWSRTYHIWLNMRQRCRNPKNPSYDYYGGRGISVCAQWDSFTRFLADMGEAPAGMSIERKDNDGDYAPGNCRWATRQEQMRNTRYNRHITFRGETKILAEWAEHFGVRRQLIRSRMEYQDIQTILEDIADGRRYANN